MTNKIIDMDELAARAKKLRDAGKKLVVTNGCFDLLHVGHVRYLQAARALGDALAIGVNGDRSVRELKGDNRPINNENDRAEVVAALGCVDFVTIFQEVRATRLLEMVGPAIYAKGGDYTTATLNPEERATLEKIGAEIRIIPFEKGYSTSRLLEKLSNISKLKLLPLGILGSGRGTNCRAILERIKSGELPAEARVVISDVLEAPILDIAREFSVPNAFLPSGTFRTRLDPQTEMELVRILRDAGVELVVLAGFMRVLKSPMLEAFPKKILNIHPSLLPKFPGLSAWTQALAAGEKVTGCTVHYVDESVDHGDIIAQREVPILPDDTPETLHARIQIAERQLYPEVISTFCREQSRV